MLQICHGKAESFLDYVLQCVLLLFLRFIDFFAKDYQHMLVLSERLPVFDMHG